MRPKWQILMGAAVLVVILGAAVGLGYSAVFNKPEPIPKKTKVERPKLKPKKQVPKTTVCSLDGKSARQRGSRPLAVMVENLSTIRPQAGLSSACVVVEGLAEGGITRFMLVFGDHGADNVGPVRSARTHFAVLAKGWDAVYGHVGGSIYAMRAIRDIGIADWDQIGHGSSYTRVGWTKAPHNVFTSTERLRRDAAKFAGGGESVSGGLKFKTAPSLMERPQGVKKIGIDFSYPAYRVEYRYDRESNTYKRFNGGKPHLDANNKMQVAPVNIAIMRAQTKAIVGGSGVLDIAVTGSGRLTVIRDGEVIEGVWEKPTYNSPLIFKDAEDKSIRLSPGQTWIEVVKPTTSITIEQ